MFGIGPVELLVGLSCFLVPVGLVAGLVVLVVGSRRRAQERAAGLAAHAHARDWWFRPADPGLVTRFWGKPFGVGHARTATNVVHGTHHGRPFTAFDYTYRTSGGDDADTTHHWSVVAVALGVTAPGLSVSRQGTLGRLAGQLVGGDISLGDPVFDRAFRVTCEDPRFAADVLHPAMRQMLMAGDDLAWRFALDSLLTLRSGHHSPAEIDARLAAADAILAQVPEPVWRALRQGPQGTQGTQGTQQPPGTPPGQ